MDCAGSPVVALTRQSEQAVMEDNKVADRRREALGLAGFLLVATAQVSNMILARGVAGTVPPLTIAFFRWTIVAVGAGHPGGAARQSGSCSPPGAWARRRR